MATATGPSVSVDDGAFRLKVDYTYTTTAIKFRPYIVVSNNFAHNQRANVKWVNTAGTWVDHYKSSVKAAATYYIPNHNYQTNGDYQITIKGIIAGKTSQVTLTSTIKPSKPAIALTYINDAHIRVAVSGTGYKAVPTNTIVIERQDLIATANWDEIRTYTANTTTAYSYTLDDQTVQRGERYRYRVKAVNTAGNSGYNTTGWIYTNPPEVSNVAHVRNSNHSCTVSWDRDIQYVDRLLITAFNIERSESGEAWTTVGTKQADSTIALTESYTDDTCTINNYYSYRIKPVNSRGVSPIAYDEGGTTPTYNTPGKPMWIKAIFKSNGNVKLVLINNEKTATALEIERSLDNGANWSALDEVDESSVPCTAYTDTTNPTGTGIQYRARNKNANLTGTDQYSAWTVSNTVSTLSAPEAPTLVLPVSGSPVNVDNQTVRLVWVHNPTDGTPQEAATIDWYTDHSSGSVSVTTDSYKDFSLASPNIVPGDVVYWRVKTKGAYTSFSAWSDYNTFTALSNPQIAFTDPDNGDVITNLPLDLSWTYADDSGSLTSLTLDILDDNNEVVYTADVPVGAGTPGTYTYSLAGYLFENNRAYGLRVTALSSSGLTATDLISVFIEYVPVRLQDSFFVDPEINEETGMVDLLISLDDSPVGSTSDPDEDEPVYINSPVDHASLYRVVNGNRVLLQQSVSAGDQFTDMYAPLNVVYQYELVEVATTGEVAIVDMDVQLNSTYWYVYWGDNNIARARWNPNGTVNLSRPERQQIRYSGRKYPVTYDSMAIEETYSFSGVIEDNNELDAFRRLIQDGGQGVWKSCDGQVYAASFDYSYAADYTLDHTTWDISLSVTHIDSKDL